MTIQKDQADTSMENASGIAEKLANLGSMDAVKDSGAFDELMGFIDRGEIQLDGKDGFIAQLIRAGLERGLKAELSSHLGYEQGDTEGRFIPNSRNGSHPKPCPPSSAISTCRSRGTGPAPSPRPWYPRTHAAPAGWTR